MKYTTKVHPINGKRGCVERDFVPFTFMSDFFTPLMKFQIPVQRLHRVQEGAAAAEFRIITFTENSKYYE